MRPFSCHDLGTTGATWLREEGIDELVIALLLGHRSIFDPGAGSFHAPSTNVTGSYTRVYERALRLQPPFSLAWRSKERAKKCNESTSLLRVKLSVQTPGRDTQIEGDIW